MAKRFQQIVDSINSLVKSGVLGSEDERFLKKALKDFNHSLSVRNHRKAKESVNKICKKLLEKVR
ncbi:hypothetical protein A2630_00640 [Candidatus Woesebacteria bacterium RIFCSPHIGHO2_01_FULL_44_10]|uniref:Uncharacterized protein n=1 Tax=Candidatus Woesebacteria bacterium RIFCSPLOWO2_01_FULL_44_14 TaxID=1802525 RepID=A0A1F8C2A3_9BACT|nr:MAG: hypothetical protein A2630_00640 [Candidatus Woesebacteria bacterium RIFCSPHIGHO2_01_FULL_44_10]OGM54369.1 MAG: hypothetical protein A3F62_01290 [Candidatus Woesebacteria bacterium RIFCSPHIGHO2_12_FULL_44_11]OGM70270.1 MAG: hypothetical protein A2975_04335 [Candidatus Woesebacteria bacterium RIFCSPLOWO2_01_FULL_44_14]